MDKIAVIRRKKRKAKKKHTLAIQLENSLGKASIQLVYCTRFRFLAPKTAKSFIIIIITVIIVIRDQTQIRSQALAEPKQRQALSL